MLFWDFWDLCVGLWFSRRRVQHFPRATAGDNLHYAQISLLERAARAWVQVSQHGVVVRVAPVCRFGLVFAEQGHIIRNWCSPLLGQPGGCRGGARSVQCAVSYRCGCDVPSMQGADHRTSCMYVCVVHVLPVQLLPMKGFKLGRAVSGHLHA